MFVLVMPFELDEVRGSEQTTLNRFAEVILPQVRRLPGYEGLWVLTTPEAKGLLVTVWTTEDAARAASASGIYDDEIARAMVLMHSSPGRDRYEVVLSDTPTAA